MKRARLSAGSTLEAVRQRELGLKSQEETQKRLQLPEAFVRRLVVEDVLRGHLGCVNRIAWNVEGSMLASGSDDRQILLWSYPCPQQPPICLETQHHANIFGVAILPETDNTCLVSGAMDHAVQLHRLDHSPLKLSNSAQTQVLRSNPEQWFYSNDGPPLKVRSLQPHTTVYNCHTGRVKTVDIEPGNPHLFWSASEDGTVRQIDRRCRDQGEPTSPNVLLAIKQKARNLELLAARVNKAKPEQIAVAANDPFVRVYDRRMLCIGNPRRSGASHNTYVAFSRRGDKVLANYHSDHCYSFDLTSAAESALQAAFPLPDPPESLQHFTQPFISRRGLLFAGTPSRQRGATESRANDLSDKALAAKNAGNRAFFDTDDTSAIYHYTEAIHLAPSCALLYSSRSAAYLKRGWIADFWAAVQDAETAIVLDPLLIKAHCRRILALVALGQLEAAKLAADAFAFLFPHSLEDLERVKASIAEEEGHRKNMVEQSMNARAAEASRQRAEPQEDQPASQALDARSNQGASGDGGEDAIDTEAETSIGSEEWMPDWVNREGWIGEEEVSSVQSSSHSPPDFLSHQYGSNTIAGAPHRTYQRYMGHSNVQTDIKEANFLGGDDQMVAACSDDGHVFIYDAETGRPIQALKADEDVVNCVQPHPSLPLLATSGIESVVKLWGPGALADSQRTRHSINSLISYNQERLKSQTSLFNSVTPRVMAALSRNSDLLHMLMAVHRERGGGAMEAESEAATPQTQAQEVSCRVT